MLNKKSLLLSLICLMFVSVLAFAVEPKSRFITERNIYGVYSDNFTGATQQNGFDLDDIAFWTWAEWWADGGNGANALAPKSELVSDGTAREGQNCLKITCLPKTNAGGWSGCGFGFIYSNGDENVDNITHFDYLDFWIRKREGNINELQIGVKAAGQNKVLSLANANVDGGTGNGVNNNSTEWQHVVISLSSLNADLANTGMPFLIICDELTVQTVFDIDNVVLRRVDSSADFNVSLKKVEDMQGAPENPTEISWLYFTGWQAAAQYIEIDADKYSNSWTVKLYVRHQGDGHNRSGLWAQGSNGEDYVVPMCFRVYNGYLKNVIESPIGEQSYLIGQSAGEGNNLYDRGVSPNADPGFYPWIWMKEYNDIDFTKQADIDSVTVWSSVKGYHAAMPFYIDGDPTKPSDGFDTSLNTKVDKTLRVYLGAGFGGVGGGIEYTATVVVDVDYE